MKKTRRSKKVSREELARILKCSTRAIANWKRAGLPVRNNRYDVEQVKAWLEQREAARDLKNAGKLNALLRWRKLRQHAAKLELAERKGILLDRTMVRRKWEEAVQTSKQLLLGIPKKIPPRIVGRTAHEIEETLRVSLDEALTTIMQLRPFDETRFLTGATQ